MPPTTPPPELTLRDSVYPTDREAVRQLAIATVFFRTDEVDIAVELVDAYLEKGEASGYCFLFAEIDGQVAGYACYGLIGCTLGSYDLYWIIVDPARQGLGLGRRLIEEAENHIYRMGGRHIYIETSGRPQYKPTRGFYERCGYSVAATLPDFYDAGDDKVIWRKICAETA